MGEIPCMWYATPAGVGGGAVCVGRCPWAISVTAFQAGGAGK